MRVSELLNNVLVINLDKDKDRWSHSVSQLQSIGLIEGKTFFRVPAIYGRSIDKELFKFFRSNYKSNYGDKYSVIGCALSHINAWKEMISRNWEYALILEDDFNLTSYIKNKLLNTIDLPEDWDIVYLGNVKNQFPRNLCSSIPTPSYDIGGKNGPITISKHLIKFIDKNTVEVPMGGWAYGISLKGARWCVENYKLEIPNDTFLVSNLDQLNVYGVIPSVINHCYDHGSNIDQVKRVNNKLIPTHLITGMTWWKKSKIFILTIIVVLLLTISLVNGHKKFWAVFLLLLILILDYILTRTNDIENLEIYYRYIPIYGHLPGVYGRDHYDPFSNVWIPKYKNCVKKLLKLLMDNCRENNIECMLIYGSLLGWARHNKRIIPWDDDMDVMVYIKDKDKLLAGLERERVHIKHMGDRFIKISLENCGEKIPNKTYTFPFIDIFLYDIDDDGNVYLVMDQKYSLGKITVQSMESKFEGVDVKVPKDYIKILSNVYGDWMDKCVSSSWNHRLESKISDEYIQKVDCELLGI